MTDFTLMYPPQTLNWVLYISDKTVIQALFIKQNKSLAPRMPKPAV